MARIARFVVPGLPHHVTQRGNRRERVFFGDDDYRLYQDLLREACDKAGVSVFRLLPDAQPCPSHPDADHGCAFSARRIGATAPSSNARLRVTAHLFFASFQSLRLMSDGGGAPCSIRIRALIVERPQD